MKEAIIKWGHMAGRCLYDLLAQTKLEYRRQAVADGSYEHSTKEVLRAMALCKTPNDSGSDKSLLKYL